MAFDNSNPNAPKGSPVYPGFNNVGGLDYRLRRLEVGAQRLRAGVIQPTSGQFARIPITAIDKQQRIDPTNPTFRKLGSVPPSGNVSGFAFTSTANSITWYWDGTNGSTVIVLKRSDSTTQVIPTTGSGLTITGLANATTYYFLPYWPPNNGSNVGWVPGTIGSPQIAFVLADTTSVNNGNFYLLEQSLQDREQLTSGFMTATTGTSGGGGGGGGGGRCVMKGTTIVTLGGIVFQTEEHEERNWVWLKSDDGRELTCTANHPLYHEGLGRVHASQLQIGDPVIMDNGVRYVADVDQFTQLDSKVCVHMAEGHLFLANGWLSHNTKPSTA